MIGVAVSFYDRHDRRERKLRVVLRGIHHNLRGSSLRTESVRRYIENYHRYPEVRPFASDILRLALAGAKSRKRTGLIQHLKEVMKGQ